MKTKLIRALVACVSIASAIGATAQTSAPAHPAALHQGLPGSTASLQEPRSAAASQAPVVAAPLTGWGHLAPPPVFCGQCLAELGQARTIMVAERIRRAAPVHHVQRERVIVYYVGGVPPRSSFPLGDYATPRAYPEPCRSVVQIWRH